MFARAIDGFGWDTSEATSTGDHDNRPLSKLLLCRSEYALSGRTTQGLLLAHPADHFGPNGPRPGDIGLDDLAVDFGRSKLALIR